VVAEACETPQPPLPSFLNESIISGTFKVCLSPSMKIKLWQFEYDFDKEDAKIVIPVLLLALGLAFTPLNKSALWSGFVVYYLLYFFLMPFLIALQDHLFIPVRHWLFFRCPYCKSRDVFLQGYEGYHSDELYAWHLCNHCGETLILINDRLIKPGPDRGSKELTASKF